MRAELKDVGFAIMVATMLRAIATGNILPASVPLVCVDINPSRSRNWPIRAVRRPRAWSPISACSSSSWL